MFMDINLLLVNLCFMLILQVYSNNDKIIYNNNVKEISSSVIS